VRKKPVVALAYDFDGTLAPGNMQEHSFIPDIGMKPEVFWKESELMAKEHKADSVLTYMNLMLKKAKAANKPVRKSDFKNHGKSIKLFEGIDKWFERITQYGNDKDLKVEHYIISSGLREMIEGTSIFHYFKNIYASSFKYDENGAAEWPALAINYTTKTQYLFRINKGVLDVSENKLINEFVPMEERPIPFERIIFIGDGETDVPCFSLVKRQGGHSIVVYKPNSKGAKDKAKKLLNEGRVNFVSPATYGTNDQIDKIVKAILTKISADCQLESLGKQ
jgi:hypothetical protein